MSEPSLTERTWDEVARLFDEAVSLPPGERDAFLHAETDDPTVRQQVDSLLRAHTDAGDFFDHLESSVFRGRRSEGDATDGDQHLSSSSILGDRYRILGRLGRGGMGVVYKARDTRLDRVVALKVLPPTDTFDEDARARFLREARSAAALQHPNVCPIHDTGETKDGALYIAMAYQPGETLDHYLGDAPFPEPVARDLMLQLANALAAAHERGIVHRDIKPSNLILSSAPGDAPHLSLIDFGLAKEAHLELTQPGTVLGTVAYMSPEQARGERVQPASDVWSLGVCLFEMLSGERPFPGSSVAEVVHGIQQKEVPLDALPGDLSPALRSVVVRCLKKEASERFPNGAAVCDALTSALNPTEAAASSTDATESPSISARMSLRWTLAAAVAVLAVGVVVWLAPPSAPPLPEPRHVVVSGAVSNWSVEPTEEAAEQVGRDALLDGIVHTVTSNLRLASSRPVEPGASTPLIVPLADLQSSAVTPEAARERHAATLLLSVSTERPTPNVVRAGLQLIDTRNGNVLREASVDLPEARSAALPDTLSVLSAGFLGLAERIPRTPPVAGTAAEIAERYCIEARGRLRNHQVEGNVDAALALFSQALNQYDAATCAHAGRGESYWRKFTASREPAWIDSAAAASEEALLSGGKNARAHTTLGLIDTERGQHGSAIFHFEYALERDPSLTRARRGLARALEAAGRHDEAERTYRDAIAQEPAYWSAYNDLGKFYIRRARYEDAAEQFKAVIQRAPQNVVGHRNLGVARYYSGDLDSAIKAFQAANDISPSYATYTNVGSLLASQGRHEEAARAYQDALSIRDADFRIWGSYAESSYHAGHHQKARTSFREALERVNGQLEVNPQSTSLLIYTSSYHLALGDTSSARAFLDRARQEGVEDASGQFSVGQILVRLGQSESAFEWFDAAVKQGYRIGNAARYPRLKAIWKDPRFSSLVDRSRAS